jgi:hypothetical protein
MFVANNDSLTIETVGGFKQYAGFLNDSKIKHITNDEIRDIRTSGKLFSDSEIIIPIRVYP